MIGIAQRGEDVWVTSDIAGTQGTTTPDQTLVPLGRGILGDEVLARIGGRAAGYDRDNRVFHEDLADLREAGYLRLAVPTELGGPGLTLPEYVRENARLAYRAPSTALAIDMHVYWTGTAAYLWRRGDTSEGAVAAPARNPRAARRAAGRSIHRRHFRLGNSQTRR
jgi:alkylation response protein AidB-like acyl-CoA dehydrogenase